MDNDIYLRILIDDQTNLQEIYQNNELFQYPSMPSQQDLFTPFMSQQMQFQHVKPGLHHSFDAKGVQLFTYFEDDRSCYLETSNLNCFNNSPSKICNKLLKNLEPCGIGKYSEQEHAKACIVLIHDFYQTPVTLLPIINYIHDQGHDVIAPLMSHFVYTESTRNSKLDQFVCLLSCFQYKTFKIIVQGCFAEFVYLLGLIDEKYSDITLLNPTVRFRQQRSVSETSQPNYSTARFSLQRDPSPEFSIDSNHERLVDSKQIQNLSESDSQSIPAPAPMRATLSLSEIKHISARPAGIDCAVIHQPKQSSPQPQIFGNSSNPAKLFIAFLPKIEKLLGPQLCSLAEFERVRAGQFQAQHLAAAVLFAPLQFYQLLHKTERFFTSSQHAALRAFAAWQSGRTMEAEQLGRMVVLFGEGALLTEGLRGVSFLLSQQCQVFVLRNAGQELFYPYVGLWAQIAGI